MVTQEERILRFLKAHPEGVHPTTIVSETGCLQYNARINGIRDSFKCLHKNGNEACAAEEHIINKSYGNKTTKFFYIQTVKDDLGVYIQRKRAEKRAENPQMSIL